MTSQLIINFHGIGEPHAGVDSAERPYWISRDAFCGIIERVAMVKSGKISRDHPIPEILITFDDGNLSDAMVALPELLRLNLKAKFFVCAGRIGQPHYLDRQAILELQNPGMEIGNHGMLQQNFTQLSSQQLEVEVTEAGKILAGICGHPIDELAIPYGAYNRRVLNWLLSRNFKTIYTSDRGMARKESRIKRRESVTAAMDHSQIPEKMLGPQPFGKAARRAISCAYKRWF